VLDRPELAERARRALDFLWQRCRKAGWGVYRSYDGKAQVPGLLADQACTATALLDAYEVSGDASYLERSQGLAAFIRQHFSDEAAGGFFDAWDQAETLGRLRERQKPLAENAVCARLFTRLYRLTDDASFRQAAQATLEAFAAVYPALGHFAAAYARAAHAFLSPYARVNIVGDAAHEGTQALLRATLRLDLPTRAVQVIHPQRDASRLQALLLPPQPWPAAYVCYDTACSPPVSRPEELTVAAQSMRDRFAPKRTS
ncbi:MAG: hypothetical protein Q8P22_05200, partial [Chloroflexota bacterium]|nr:hypothetical protein [Chloroflexota bacterium]